MGLIIIFGPSSDEKNDGPNIIRYDLERISNKNKNMSDAIKMEWQYRRTKGS